MHAAVRLFLLVNTLILIASSHAEQIVLSSPNAAAEPTSPDLSSFLPMTHTPPLLSDLLTIDTSLSIFFSYAREIETSSLFSNETAKTTLLAPTNKAVMALARKPHQGPAPLEDGLEITDQEFADRSKRNVERWVTAHIIPKSPISLSSHTYPTLLRGKSVTFSPIGDDPTTPEWSRAVINDEIHIIRMKQASNGVLYVIDSTISVS